MVEPLQRDTLLQSRATLSMAGSQLESSRRIIQSMARRAAANKLVLYLIIGAHLPGSRRSALGRAAASKAVMCLSKREKVWLAHFLRGIFRVAAARH